MRSTPARFATALLAGAVFAVAGCGDEELDTARNEAFIRDVVVSQAGARVASVSCPDGLNAQEGARFTCVVTGTDGSRGEVAVRQAAGRAIRVQAPFLHPRDVEDFMTRPLARRVRAPVKVACQEIVLARRGERFRCRATFAGQSRAVTARLTDDAGHFSYRLAERRRR